ncbi:MAG: hypothetical protein D3917_17840, partial [Candidatus Electrothrix sp. AX5]|nr:hypothetical protein [Candidatus Electrothrix sp. AX5]
TEDDVESITIIRRSGKDLLYLINDILDLSKIEAGQMILVQDDILISELLAELKSTFLHLAEKKGLPLHFILAEDVPNVIRSDRKRIDQILKNLLSNALKFTERGAITVSVSLCTDPSAFPDIIGQDIIALSVQDSGIGIPQDKQKVILRPFSRLMAARRENMEELGSGYLFPESWPSCSAVKSGWKAKRGKVRCLLYISLYLCQNPYQNR